MIGLEQRVAARSKSRQDQQDGADMVTRSACSSHFMMGSEMATIRAANLEAACCLANRCLALCIFAWPETHSSVHPISPRPAMARKHRVTPCEEPKQRGPSQAAVAHCRKLLGNYALLSGTPPRIRRKYPAHLPRHRPSYDARPLAKTPTPAAHGGAAREHKWHVAHIELFHLPTDSLHSSQIIAPNLPITHTPPYAL